jgi:hypothetical protein
MKLIQTMWEWLRRSAARLVRLGAYTLMIVSL